MNELVPVAGATKGSRCPKTALAGDSGILSITDTVSGHSVRLRPAGLYHYSYDLRPSKRSGRKDPSQTVQGVAALDADGLVMVDLPGDWHAPHLERFARAAGIPLVDARNKPSDQVRKVLSGRAPGWQRLRGLSRPVLTVWRKAAIICAGVAGLGVMAYLASTGMWTAWRGVATLGRFILDLLDAKWLVVIFSPALLVLRPARARFHRRRVEQGSILGPLGGPCLRGRFSQRLQVIQRNEILADLRLGVDEAYGLLLYRHEDVTGLAILNRFEHVLHHLPGPWPPNDVDRFAKRQGLSLTVAQLSREEYLALIGKARTATP